MSRNFSLSVNNQERHFVQSGSIVPLTAYIPLAHDLASLTEVVHRTAIETGRRLSGFIISTSHEVNSFTLTAYPRNKYGTPCPTTFEAVAQTLAHGLNSSVEHDPLATRARILFGLVEGYSGTGKLHTTQEVAHHLGDAALQPATILASYLQHDGTLSDYTEPAVVINTHPERLNGVFMLADKLGQERVIVEDFTNQRTYLVETEHCTEPDGQFTPHIL